MQRKLMIYLTLRLAVKKDALFHYNIDSLAGTGCAIFTSKTSLFLLICSILVSLSMALLFYTHTGKYVLIITITQRASLQRREILEIDLQVQEND
jgi:hypothetical protein